MPGVPAGHGHLPKMFQFWPLGGLGPTSPFPSCPLVKCPQHSLWGLLSEGVPSTGSWKVTHLSSLCQLGDPSHLSRDLPQWQLWLQGCWCWMPSASLLSLSIFNSSMWVASNVHWRASLASQRASLCGWPVLQDWEWDSVWQLGCGVATAVPFCPPPTWQCLLIFIGSSSGKTGCFGWPLPSVQAKRVAGWAAFWVSILHGRDPKSPTRRFRTPQAGWQVHLPLGLAFAGHANGLSR